MEEQQMEVTSDPPLVTNVERVIMEIPIVTVNDAVAVNNEPSVVDGTITNNNDLHPETRWSPNLSGEPMGTRSIEATNIRCDMNQRIRNITSPEQFLEMYHNPFFGSCVNVIRIYRMQYNHAVETGIVLPQQPGDDWSVYWAIANRNGDAEWASIIEACRKILMTFLNELCPRWNFRRLKDSTRLEDTRFIDCIPKHNISNILTNLLPLDRSNFLYLMSPDQTANPMQRGMCWYCSYDDATQFLLNRPEMISNPDGKGGMNKYYVWLYDKFYSDIDHEQKDDTDKQMNRFVESNLRIAVPSRLLHPNFHELPMDHNQVWNIRYQRMEDAAAVAASATTTTTTNTAGQVSTI